MNYEELIKSKTKKVQEVGFDADELNEKLFDFQKFIVKKALKAGRYGVFADCGMGKTFMQIEWAWQVYKFTGKPVLILCPLAVSGQTKEEALKLGYAIQDAQVGNNALFCEIQISNYEQLKNIDCSIFGGVVLDESSILKNYNGAYKNLILGKFEGLRFKLACTATPSPNDHIELGNHAEFLGVCRSKEMVSMYFINDAFNKDHTISKWRLKKHAESDFWKWVASWSIMVSNPSDFGFDGSKYILPELNITEVCIKAKKKQNLKIIDDISVSATEFYKELAITQSERCRKVADLVNSSKENFIIWVKTDDEEKEICSLITDAIAVNGSDKPSLKESRLLGFAHNEFRVLVTKTKIAQFGLNYQNCRNQVFLSFDFSFEGLYQAIRRSWRFGQKEQVNIHLVTVDSMGNVLKSIKDKQQKFEKMQKEMQNNINSIEEQSYENGFLQFNMLAQQLERTLKSGRLCTIHCTQLSTSKGKDGVLEIIDFRGDIIRSMRSNGFIFHAEVSIWKDPKIIAQRTKNVQLLHATTKRDSTVNRMGFPDYLLTFKKQGENETPVNHEGNGLPFEYWCKLAEPHWPEGEIDAGDVLNVKDAKASKDEKHMTPTQKEPIKRMLHLYTNPNDLVYCPFSGFGTEAVVCLENDRRVEAVELKKHYFDISVRFAKNAEMAKMQTSLF